MTPSSPRRTLDRTEVVLPVTLEHDGRTLSGTARNLSLGGLFVEIDAVLAFGATVVVRFTLPGQSQEIATSAQVRWTAGTCGVGLQFQGLRAWQVWALQQFIGHGGTET